jgi:hypothetical protein
MAAKWSTILESQSLIYLSLDIKKKYSETGWNDDYSVRSYRIVAIDSTSSAFSAPRVEIYYYDTAPGVFFPTISGPKESIKNFLFFKPGYSVDSKEIYHKTSKVRLHYLLVHQRTTMRDCIAFVGKSGQGDGDGQTSDGTSYFLGYYCNPVNEKFDQAKIDTILQSIGIKEQGVIAPAPMSKKTDKKTLSSVSLKDKASQLLKSDKELEEKLETIKQLFKKKLITQEEYDAMRKKILGLN